MSENTESPENILDGILKSSSLEDFVIINEDDMQEEDNSLGITIPEGITKDAHQKVDLVKLAYLYLQGYDTTAMARTFDVTNSRINEIKHSEKFKSIMGAINKEIIATARTFMGAAGIKATVTLIKCLDSYDEKVKLKAATEVLDRIGITTPKQLEIIQSNDNNISGMSDEQLMEFIKKGMTEIRPVIKGVANDNITITEISKGET